ncbi:hypothetical protein C8T65DRAFT_64215 [Cerioporus squamosus]|nr:hypothetical protein C8T65DRAFT_64215 [Cerioporus squamosus]
MPREAGQPDLYSDHPHRRPSITLSFMQQCRAQITGENGQRTRCKNQRPPDELCCHEHALEYRRQMDADKTAVEEVDKLEILAKGAVQGGFTRTRNVEEVGKMEETMNAYAKSLERAIQGTQEHQRRFFVEPTAHAERVKDLRDKRLVALAIAANVESYKQYLLAEEENKKRQTPEEREQEIELQKQIQQAQVRVNKMIREQKDTFPLYDAIMVRCAAHLAYDEETRCAAPARRPEKFCRVHREDHRVAALQLDQVTQAAEESHAKTDATMQKIRLGRASPRDAIPDVRSYLAALDEELQVVEAHQRLFQCKAPAEHADKVAHLKSQRTLVKQVLDSVLAEEEKDELYGEALLGAVASGVGACFGMSWGRSILIGAMVTLGLRFTREREDMRGCSG